jgi:hypothetical protein
MKSFLILILSFISNANVYANSNWVYIGTNNDGYIFLIDKNSIQKNGDSRTYWYQTNFNNRDEYGHLSTKTQVTINCRTRENIQRYLMTYDDIKNMGKLTHSFVPKDEWTPIAPDSISWYFFEYVCK